MAVVTSSVGMVPAIAIDRALARKARNARNAASPGIAAARRGAVAGFAADAGLTPLFNGA